VRTYASQPSHPISRVSHFADHHFVPDANDEDGGVSPPSRARSAAPISADIVEVLKSIRSLSTSENSQNTVSADKASCLELQQQIKLLQTRANLSRLEECSLLAAFNYIELILLNTPISTIMLTKTSNQLDFALAKPWSESEAKGARDIIRWISAACAASMGVRDRRNENSGLIKRLNKVVTRLEKLPAV